MDHAYSEAPNEAQLTARGAPAPLSPEEALQLLRLIPVRGIKTGNDSKVAPEKLPYLVQVAIVSEAQHAMEAAEGTGEEVNVWSSWVAHMRTAYGEMRVAEQAA